MRKIIRYEILCFCIMIRKTKEDNIMLKVENVEKYYGSRNNVTKALDRINLQIDKGECIAIMGASGSGKTTLLNCIATIDTVSAGNIRLNGRDITEIKETELAKFRREKLGFVFQDYNLLDTLTIEENIGLSLTINHEKPNRVQKKVQKVARLLGIEDILGKFPYQVSGGQKQRAACGRAIVNRQDLILADEPTGALDSKATKDLLEIFKQINEEMHATILMVTHDAYSASYASRILFLKDGKIFNEVLKGNKTRSQLYNEVLDVLALLGGDVSDVI